MIRLTPNLRRYALRRPESRQRLYRRLRNFGVRFCFAIHAFVAIFFPFVTLLPEPSLSALR
ncbi:hypothetical protein MAMC_00822 [Methylacidimicrobium cyclopophantes]|uniref:Uncharacterized protein n=1 Tax=Methylacidimicrobium cyclopophantes TaxID=1041766 RepID=A0A5E6MK08_9BACT|nr:hypothetical protein MAMC_00822 [Methylacidimicrobium cyclopophantes]